MPELGPYGCMCSVRARGNSRPYRDPEVIRAFRVCVQCVRHVRYCSDSYQIGMSHPEGGEGPECGADNGRTCRRS